MRVLTASKERWREGGRGRKGRRREGRKGRKEREKEGEKGEREEAVQCVYIHKQVWYKWVVVIT